MPKLWSVVFVRNIVTNTTFLFSNIQNLSTSIQCFIPRNIAPMWIMMPACWKPSWTPHTFNIQSTYTSTHRSVSVSVSDYPFYTCTRSLWDLHMMSCFFVVRVTAHCVCNIISMTINNDALEKTIVLWQLPSVCISSKISWVCTIEH